MKTYIATCTCINEYQDNKYGVSNRLHNATSKQSGSTDKVVARCTICTKEKSIKK